MPETVIQVLSSIGTLLLIVAIFVGAYFASKAMGKRYQSFDASKTDNMEIIEKKHFGKDQSLIIVRIGSRYFVLGVTPQNIQKLDEIDAEELSFQKNRQEAQASPFLHVFKEVWTKNTGGFLKRKEKTDTDKRENQNEKR